MPLNLTSRFPEIYNILQVMKITKSILLSSKTETKTFPTFSMLFLIRPLWLLSLDRPGFILLHFNSCGIKINHWPRLSLHRIKWSITFRLSLIITFSTSNIIIWLDNKLMILLYDYLPVILHLMKQIYSISTK